MIKSLVSTYLVALGRDVETRLLLLYVKKQTMCLDHDPLMNYIYI